MFKDEVLAMRDSPVTLHNTSAKFRSHFLLRCGENSTSTLNHISELKAFFQNPSARKALQETIVSEPLAEGKFAFHFRINVSAAIQLQIIHTRRPSTSSFAPINQH